MGRNSTFTDKELDLIRDMWPTSLPDKMLGAVLKRSESGVRKAAQRLGLPMRRLARTAATEHYLRLIQERAE